MKLSNKLLLCTTLAVILVQQALALSVRLYNYTGIDSPIQYTDINNNTANDRLNDGNEPWEIEVSESHPAITSTFKYPSLLLPRPGITTIAITPSSDKTDCDINLSLSADRLSMDYVYNCH